MSAGTQRAMTARERGLLALLSLLWGGSFFFIGVAVKELPPPTLVTLRVGIAAALLRASASLGVSLPRNGKAGPGSAGLRQQRPALPFTLIAWGQTHRRAASPRSSSAPRSLGLMPIDVAAVQATAATLFLAPFALVLDRPWSLPIPSRAAIACVLAIAALSIALGYVVYFKILDGAGATNALLASLLVPATSVVLGALILHERLMASRFLGFALIALGLAFIDGRLPRALFSRANGHVQAARDSRLPMDPKPR